MNTFIKNILCFIGTVVYSLVVGCIFYGPIVMLVRWSETSFWGVFFILILVGMSAFAFFLFALYALLMCPFRWLLVNKASKIAATVILALIGICAVIYPWCTYTLDIIGMILAFTMSGTALIVYTVSIIGVWQIEEFK